MSLVNGTSYAEQPERLRKQVEDLLREAEAPPVDGEPLAAIVPDADALQGGAAAARVYKALEGHTFDTVILVVPSHRESFRRMNICSFDAYPGPLGPVPISDRVRNELCDEDDDIFIDDTGHFGRAGVGVQLPFLKAVLGDVSIVPIVMGEETTVFCQELGAAVGEIMYNHRMLVLATADVLRASEEALEAFVEAFEARAADRLTRLLSSEEVLLKGKGPVLTVIIAALRRRASQARVLHLEPPRGEQPGFLGALLWR